MSKRRGPPSATQMKMVKALEERINELEGQITEDRKTLVQSRMKVMLDKTSKGQAGHDSDLLRTLNECYEQVPWISAPIDTIAKRMTSGGFEIIPTRPNPNQSGKRRIENLLYYVNDEEDFVELCMMTIVALMVFGRAYWEVVWSGVPRESEPLELHFVDPVTIRPDMDEFGRIKRFIQKMEGDVAGDDEHIFEPGNIIWFKMRGPRGNVISPIEKLITSATVYNHMMRWSQKFFEQGAKPPFALQLPEETDEDEGDRQIEWYEQNYTGVDNAHRIWVLWGGAEIKELGAAGKMIEFDFLESMKYLRTEFLSILGVPPAMVGIVETGNIGGGTGESQDKTLRYNTIEPLRRILEEKVNYVLIQLGMQCEDWKVRLKERDYRSDDSITTTVIQKVHEGLINRNEGRKYLGEDGEVPGGGGEVATVTMPGELVPVTQIPLMSSAQIKNLDPDQADQAKELELSLTRKQIQTMGQAPAGFGSNSIANKQPGSGVKKEDAERDLSRWQRIARSSLKDGKPMRSFSSSHIPQYVQTLVTSMLPHVREEPHITLLFDEAFRLTRKELADATL